MEKNVVPKKSEELNKVHIFNAKVEGLALDYSQYSQ